MRAAIDVLAANNEGNPNNPSNTKVPWHVVRVMLWGWIDANAEQKVSLKIWFLRASFKIKDLHDVFALLLGPRPDYSAP